MSLRTIYKQKILVGEGNKSYNYYKRTDKNTNNYI